MVRCLLAIFIPLGADEAYYYVYTLNPSLSYFDHPPMVALVGSVIPFLTGIASPFALRLLPLILFSLTLFVFYKFCLLYMEEKKALFATGVFGAIPMFFISGSALMPDSPLIFFWVLSLYLFKKNIDNPTNKGWILFGLSAGAATLSKYTGIFLFSAAYLFILINPEKRGEYKKLGPYLAGLFGLLVFMPVILWNINIGFASFSFQAGRVGIASLRLKYFFQSLGGQIGYLFPFYFFPAAYLAFKSLRKIKEKEIYLFSALFGSLPLLFFWGASLYKRGLPHWPIIGYMSLAPLTGLFYYSLLQRRRKLFNFYAAFHLVLLLIVAGTAILQTKTGFIMNEPLAETSIPEKTRLRDLTAEISGWDQVGTYLSELDMEEKFLFTHRWELGGYITHGLRGEYPLICLGNLNRARGYAFWQEQDEFIGQDGIFISSARYFADPLELYQDYFEDIEYLGELPLIRQGIKVKKIYFYLARNFSGGFPVFGI